MHQTARSSSSRTAWADSYRGTTSRSSTVGETCRALITFGTPYRGAISAIDFIANGYKQVFADLTAVLRSCPAVFPIYKALKENGLWRRLSEGALPNAVPDYVAAAAEFHDEIRNAVGPREGG